MFITQNITKYIKNSKRVKDSLRVVHICNSIRVQGLHRESEASLNPPLYTQKREKSTNYRAISSALFLNLENKYRDIYVSCIVLKIQIGFFFTKN